MAKEILRNWYVIVDDWKARLLEPVTAPNHRVRLEVRASFEDTWEEKQHGRPSGLSRKGGQYDYAGQHHESEEHRRRFGREVVAWLDEQMRAHELRHVDVLAATRVLGELRHAGDAHGLKRVEWHDGDLGFLDVGEMAQHPRMQALLARPPASV